MATTTTKKREIDWVIPMNNDCQPTLAEYRAHVAEAERSGDIPLEQFMKEEQEWLKTLS